MAVVSDELWNPSLLRAEGAAAHPVALMVDFIQQWGFTQALDKGLLRDVALADFPSSSLSPSQNSVLPRAGPCEVNALFTVLGYNQVPRFLKDPHAHEYYPVVLDACLRRLVVRLREEDRIRSLGLVKTEPPTLTHVLAENIPVLRDFLSVFYDYDSFASQSSKGHCRKSTRASILQIMEHLAPVFQRQSLGEDRDLDASSCTGANNSKRSASSSSGSLFSPIVYAVADFSCFQSPFKSGIPLDARLDLLYRSSGDNQLLNLLPSEHVVREALAGAVPPSSLRPDDPYFLDPSDKYGSLAATLRVLTRAASCAWVCTVSAKFPRSMQQYTPEEQKASFERISQLAKSGSELMNTLEKKRSRYFSVRFENSSKHLVRELFSALSTPVLSRRKRLLNKLKMVNRKTIALKLGFRDESWIEEVNMTEMLAELRAFSRRIEIEEPEISGTEKEAQAIKNLWACFVLQMILFRENPRSNDAVFGFSMMYPKTDNFLDNVQVARKDKVLFQKALHGLIRGDPMSPVEEYGPINQAVKDVAVDVQLVERQWPRQEFPTLYLAALALNNAQTLSVSAQSWKSPRTKVMEATLFKGGTSVLVDAYMVKGNLTLEEAGFSFMLGCGLQIMDDLQDVSEDTNGALRTLFTPRDGEDRVVSSYATDMNGRRLFHYLSLVWCSRNHGLAVQNNTRETTSDGQGLAMINPTQRIAHIMALKAMFRVPHIFGADVIKEASTYCTVLPSEMSKVRGLSILHAMAKADQI